MTRQQLHLFPLPAAAPICVTEHEHKALMWIAYGGGRGIGGPRPRFRVNTLRRLIERDLIKVVALSPARYELTIKGKAARAQRSKA